MKPHLPLSRPGRTIELKFLCAGSLLLSWMGWLRLFEALAEPDLWANLFAAPSPAYLAASGLLSGLIGLVVGAMLWLRLPQAPLAARTAACLAAAMYWIERALFSRSTGAWTNWPFAAGLTLLIVALVFLVLAHPRQKRQWQ